MAKINVSKEIILSVANQDNSKFVDNIDEKVNELFSAAIEKLSENISYVTIDNVYFQPVNELFNGAMLDNSSFIYLLGVENAQLEINTVNCNQFWRNLKERFKFAWENRKFFNKKRKKKRKKKKNKEVEEQEIPEIKFDATKYNIYSLTNDLQDTLIQYLSTTSICYAKDNIITLVGRDDFGINTQIIVKLVNYTDPVFKEFKSKKKGFIETNIDNRFNAFDEKYQRVGDNYVKLIKIFNLLYFNTNKIFPNQVFVESILNYCPDELYNGKDMYDVFVKIINFLYYKSLKEIKSVNDPTKSILDDEVCGNDVFGYKKMLSAILSKDEK